MEQKIFAKVKAHIEHSIQRKDYTIGDFFINFRKFTFSWADNVFLYSIQLPNFTELNFSIWQKIQLFKLINPLKPKRKKSREKKAYVEKYFNES